MLCRYLSGPSVLTVAFTAGSFRSGSGRGPVLRWSVGLLRLHPLPLELHSLDVRPGERPPSRVRLAVSSWCHSMGPRVVLIACRLESVRVPLSVLCGFLSCVCVGRGVSVSTPWASPGPSAASQAAPLCAVRPVHKSRGDSCRAWGGRFQAPGLGPRPPRQEPGGHSRERTHQTAAQASGTRVTGLLRPLQQALRQGVSSGAFD